MTEPSQYFKGRTVQEQMNEVIGYVDVRSAEVATTAIAADVAQVHQDMLDADADAQAAAASAAAAAGTLANAVKKTGEASQSIAGDIAVAGNLTGGSVTVPTPVNNTDAANKKYVDDYHDATKIDITAINSYAVGLTGNQGPIAGIKEFSGRMDFKTGFNSVGTASEGATIQRYLDRTDNSIIEGTLALSRNISAGSETSRQLMQTIYDGSNYARLSLELLPNGTARIVLYKSVNGVPSAQTVVTL